MNGAYAILLGQTSLFDKAISPQAILFSQKFLHEAGLIEGKTAQDGRQHCAEATSESLEVIQETALVGPRYIFEEKPAVRVFPKSLRHL